jgi:protein SCO1
MPSSKMLKSKVPRASAVMKFNPARRAFGAGAASLLFGGLLAAGPAWAWNSTNVSDELPALQFTLTRSTDGKIVTAADYKGKIVLLYFGYTFCPDVCPTTLLNIADMLKTLGKKADDVRVLFVTVDPNRDSLPVLKTYAAAFAPQVIGLRGTADQLAALAKRYRVSYSVTPASPGHPYEVTHSAAVYVFNRGGAIKLLFTGLSKAGFSLAGTTEDLRNMVDGEASNTWWRRILSEL